MSTDPHQILTKVCRTCGGLFDSPRYYNKEYCSVRCRRQAKHSRELERIPPPTDARFFLQVFNPNTDQLDRYAQLVLQGATDGKPIQFTGLVPYWISPSGVVLAEQFGVEPKQWIMQRVEPANDLVTMLSS